MARSSAKGIDRPWIGRAALTFVLLTLVILVAAPQMVDRRVRELRAQREAAEPARTLLGRLQYVMMREMATLTELMLTGDPDYVLVYRMAREDEAELLASLEPLAVRLGPTVVTRLAEVRELAAQWHAEINEDAILAGIANGNERGSQRARARFESALASITAMDAAVVQANDRLNTEIREVELMGLRLNTLLGLLAFGAAGAVANLYNRARRFAEEAEHRREEAEAALVASTRADEARILLLRGFTHDVKNPLGAAKGYAELLAIGAKAPLHPEQAPLVEGIQRSLDNALKIIADLLEAARAEAGGISVRPRPVDLNAVAKEAVEDHSAAAEAAGHTIEFRPAPGSAVTRTDPARVKQVLANLFSNAIKYTPPPGRITVSLEVSDDARGDGQRGEISVKVSDTGPGVPEDERDYIFDEFTRLNDRSGPKGHGLGLPIARRIARILGGDLTLEENGGPGSTFVLSLPKRATK